MKDTYDKKCAYSDDKSGKIHIFNFISYYKCFLIKNIVSICKISNNHRKQHKKIEKNKATTLKKVVALKIIRFLWSIRCPYLQDNKNINQNCRT